MNIARHRIAALFIILLSGCSPELDDFNKAPPLTPVGEGLGTSAGESSVGGVEALSAPGDGWIGGSADFFRDPRASRKGDLLTVRIGIDDKAKGAACRYPRPLVTGGMMSNSMMRVAESKSTCALVTRSGKLTENSKEEDFGTMLLDMGPGVPPESNDSLQIDSKCNESLVQDPVTEPQAGPLQSFPMFAPEHAVLPSPPECTLPRTSAENPALHGKGSEGSVASRGLGVFPIRSPGMPDTLPQSTDYCHEASRHSFEALDLRPVTTASTSTPSASAVGSDDVLEKIISCVTVLPEPAGASRQSKGSKQIRMSESPWSVVGSVRRSDPAAPQAPQPSGDAPAAWESGEGDRVRSVSDTAHSEAQTVVSASVEAGASDQRDDQSASSPAQQIVQKLVSLGSASGSSSLVDVQRGTSSGSIKILRMKLRPEELGDVEVTLRRSGNEMKIHVTVARAEAAAVLQRDQTFLEERLGSLLNAGGERSLTILVQTLSPSAPASPLPDMRQGAEMGSSDLGKSPGEGGRPSSGKEEASSRQKDHDRGDNEASRRHPAAGLVV